MFNRRSFMSASIASIVGLFIKPKTKPKIKEYVIVYKVWASEVCEITDARFIQGKTKLSITNCWPVHS